MPSLPRILFLTGDHDSSTIRNLPLLSKPSNLIHWKCRVKAYLKRDDPELLSLGAEPPATPATRHNEWHKKVTKAKITIILCLGSATMSHTRLLIEDETKNAKDLWDELNKHCTTSSTQMVLNLKQKLDSLYFNDAKGNWKVHVTEFFTICDELSTSLHMMRSSPKRIRLTSLSGLCQILFRLCDSMYLKMKQQRFILYKTLLL